MFRLIYALIPVLLITTPSIGQQSLVGTYKIISGTNEVDGRPYELKGKSLQGYLVLTPTRLICFYTGENRKFGTSDADKAALLDSLTGYAGVYRVEGDKLIYTTEVIWTESGKGTTRVERWELSGNRLTLTVGPMPFPRDPSKTMIRRQV